MLGVRCSMFVLVAVSGRSKLSMILFAKGFPTGELSRTTGPILTIR
jgi:hypothetical protein